MPMGDRPLYLRATMIFGAGHQPALFQYWANLIRGFAGCAGFHSAYLLRGCGQAPAAAGLSLFTDRAAHDRTLEQSMASVPPAAVRQRVRDVVPVSFELTTLTGELPEEPFTARLLLHREPLAGIPALRRFLARRQRTAAATPSDTVFTGRILDGGQLYCSLVLTPAAGASRGERTFGLDLDGPPQADDAVGFDPLRHWWSFAAVATVGNDGRAHRLDGYWPGARGPALS